jgi:hypothetical protein
MPPEPVTGLCSLPRWATMLADPGRHRVGVAAGFGLDLREAGRIDIQRAHVDEDLVVGDRHRGCRSSRPPAATRPAGSITRWVP